MCAIINSPAQVLSRSFFPPSSNCWRQDEEIEIDRVGLFVEDGDVGAVEEEGGDLFEGVMITPAEHAVAGQFQLEFERFAALRFLGEDGIRAQSGVGPGGFVV